MEAVRQSDSWPTWAKPTKMVPSPVAEGVLLAGVLLAGVLPAGVLCWLFPLLGRFEYGVRGLFRTALQLTIAHLPSTVIIVLLTAQSAVFCLNRWWPVVFLPTVAVLLVSLFTERIFQKYVPELAEEETQETEE